METYLLVILWTVAAAAAVLINFALHAKHAVRLLTWTACVTAVGGILSYGFAYAALDQHVGIAVLDTILATSRIFIGEYTYQDISHIPVVATPLMQGIFLILHILGMFSSVGAVIAALGADLLRRIRLLLSMRGNLALIYGVTPDSLRFGQALLQKEKTALVFIDPEPGQDYDEEISDMGCLLRSDPGALSASPAFLANLGIRPGKRAFSLYALTEDPIRNQTYARALCRSLEARGVHTRQTSLTILSEAQEASHIFQAADDRYGYGTTIAIHSAELSARLMTLLYPPCDTLTFDGNGLAKEDFHTLIVGFGKLGQSVLKQLVMNGQFEGSQFKAAVFAPELDQMDGFLRCNCQSMLENYDIRFFSQDGRSRQIFQYLQENADTLKYIVICTGNDRLNAEIQQQLRQFLLNLHREPLICCCNHHTLSRQISPEDFRQDSIFSPDLLCSHAIDRVAMVLNHTYCQDKSRTPLENWLRCDPFSRMSSRASADFAPAFLRAAGTDEAAVLSQGWAPQGALLENLAKTEHLRWCAFHYAMGFSPMSEAAFRQRSAIYLEEKSRTGSSKFRISKDMEGKSHACLIPWDALDTLSREENAVTGGSVDYKRYDVENVLALGDLLRAAQQAES